MWIKRRSLSIALAALALGGLPHAARAWFNRGHEQIADIAWTRLTPRARHEVGVVLRAGDPGFRPQGNSDAAVRQAFDLAATFPDTIKTDTGTIYEPLIGPMNRLFQPNLDLNMTDREAFRCKTWHYYDTPIRYSGPRPPVRSSNALVALADARRQLAAQEATPHPDRQRECWWLYWAEHLTGDLHQPLHCATSYQFSPQGDAGGNRFRLGVSDPETSGRMLSLHTFWDGGIERAIQQEATGGLSDRLPDVTQRWTRNPAITPAPSAVQDQKIADWIAEGAKNADTEVYSGIQPDGVPSDNYRSRQAVLCKRLAVLAGDRLAVLLNATLGKPTVRATNHQS